MPKPDFPEFIAATLPQPQQWAGRMIWRPDLGVHQVSNGSRWNITPVAAAVQPGYTVLAIGDSRIHRINAVPAPTSMVRTNGVMVVTLAGHGLGSGKLIDANNAIDSTANVRNATITRIDANNFSFPSPGPDGVMAAVAGKVLVLTLHEQLNDDGCWVWLNSRFGGSLQLVRNAGVSSNTIADMLARFDADVLPYPSKALLAELPFFNDVVNAKGGAGYTLAELIDPVNGLYEQFLAKCLATQRAIWLVGPSPLNTGNTAARHQMLLAVIKWCRKKARENPGIIFCDVYSKEVNATAGTPGNAKAGVIGDGIHETAFGSELWSQTIFEAVQSTVPRMNVLVSSSGDNYATDPSNTNVMPLNAFWQAAGGVVNAASGGGVNSGAIGQGLQCDAVLGAGGTAVWSMVARDDGIGFNARCVLTSAANNNYALLRLAANVPIANAPGGTKLRVAFEVTLSNLAGSNLRTINALLNFQGGASPSSAYILAGSANTAANWLQPSSGALVRSTTTATLSPAQVAANTTAEQTLTVPGLLPGDVVTAVNKPTAQAGLGIVGMRVSGVDTLAITFSNNTAAPINPTAAELYRIDYARTVHKITIVSQEIVVPTDPGITGFDFNVYFVCGAAGTPVVCEVGRVSNDKQ